MEYKKINMPGLLHGGDYNPEQWLDRPDILEEARQKGIIDGYVEKPVSDTAILEAIRNRANQLI